MYIDDFTVSSEEIANGNAIELTVKAHFSARVGGWEINFVFPEGMYPVNCEGGIDTIIRYYNSNGKPRTADATISSYDNYTRIMGFSTTTTLGYWQDPNGDDPSEWVPYGPIQWEGGDYDEMMFLYVEVDQNFQGGDIIMNSTFSAFPDTRGGTIKENGDSGVLFTHVCHVSADYGISVGGIAVTGKNVADITGASITGGTVNFNPATHVLTLTDATIACNTAPGIQVTTNYGFDDLTIRLVGNNNININSYTPVALRCQTTLTGPGSLTVKLNGYNGNISMIGGHQLMIDGGCTIYSSDIDGSNSAATLKVR
jgi:hypothetical protein